MCNDTTLDMEKLELLVVDWNNTAPGARDALLEYVTPWLYFIANTDFFEKKQSINTAIRIFGNSEDISQDVSEQLLLLYPTPEKGYFKHKKFLGAPHLKSEIRLMMLGVIAKKAEKFTLDRNSINKDEYINSYNITEQVSDDDMQNIDVFIALATIFKNIPEKDNRKLVCYDLKVIEGATFEEVAMIMGLSLSTVKKYVSYIELKVISKLGGMNGHI